MIQMSRCSFDIHVQEVFGSLTFGSTLVMVRPHGTMSFDYLIGILESKQITYMHTVPSLLLNFVGHIRQEQNWHVLKYMHCLVSSGKRNTNTNFDLRSILRISSGEPFSMKLVDLLMQFDWKQCRIWNLYGPAETTIDSTYHLIDIYVERNSVPIGCPLPNYHCLIKNFHLQDVIINQEGELFVGGVGVFAGYLGRDDLTAKALVDIDGEIYYRTGDLVRLDEKGLLHYIGRKDHQVKLHGQRIELGEIERCLLNITSISACVVMKWDDDYLVAYVQSSSVSEDELRSHCQSHLPPHMIPSIFIVLDKLPLNANGKIDRKQLPLPNRLTSTLSSSSSDTYNPLSDLEKRVQSVWFQVLRCKEEGVSVTTNFFSVGGHSLLFIELYHRYQAVLAVDSAEISIALFLQQPTIREHAKLLEQVTQMNIELTRWCPLHLVQGNRSASCFSDFNR